MIMTYSDALALALDAVRGGEPLDDVLARLPQHAARLRADVVLTREVCRFATAVRPPSDQARASAAAGLQGQLRASRAAAAEGKRVGRRPWLRRAPAMPRLAAFAVAVAALALVAVALLPGGDGRVVEAAVLEGVVIEREGDSLTIQTLDALEQIVVPADTPIADVAGVRIGLDRISVGEVVVVEVRRDRGSVVAQQVAKLQESIDVWCSDASERCRVLAGRLEAAEADCRLEPRACQAFVERLAELRQRATDVASLEELKARCRSGNATACESLVAFCRAHSAICGDLPLALPGDIGEDADLRERLPRLRESCAAGSAAACRQLVSLCESTPALCPADLVRPSPTPVPDRQPEPTPTRPTEATPTPAPPEPDDTPVRDGDAPSDRLSDRN